jgi:protein-S-isoprenylcysteine O-methyltransferase Ste14
MSLTRASQFEFRYRFWLIGLFFVIAFSLYGLDRENAGAALLRGVFGATPNLKSDHGRHQLQAVFGVAALVVMLAAMFRTWASAYLRSEVVHDMNLHSEDLVADGPYRYTRNPLYLGSLFTVMGFALLASRLGWFVLVGLTLWLLYRLIAREEDEMLQSQGERFREYCALVPRFWPAFRARIPASKSQPRWLQAFVGESIHWCFAAAVGIYALTLDVRYIYWIVNPMLIAYTILQIVWKRSRRAQSRS